MKSPKTYLKRASVCHCTAIMDLFISLVIPLWYLAEGLIVSCWKCEICCGPVFSIMCWDHSISRWVTAYTECWLSGLASGFLPLCSKQQIMWTLVSFLQARGVIYPVKLMLWSLVWRKTPDLMTEKLTKLLFWLELWQFYHDLKKMESGSFRVAIVHMSSSWMWHYSQWAPPFS